MAISSAKPNVQQLPKKSQRGFVPQKNIKMVQKNFAS